MDSFNFSQKRLLALPKRRQHKWIKRWLRDIYGSTLSGQIALGALELFFKQYNQVLGWIGEPLVSCSKMSDRKAWVEFLSQQFHHHQAQMELGLKESDFLPKVLTGDETTDRPWEGQLNYIVALDNFRSAFNVGSIFRTTDASGFQSVVLGGKTPGPDHNQVRKTSMGSTNWIPGRVEKNLAAHLADASVPVIGVETVENAQNYHTFNWPESAILVLGNEEYGLSQEVMAECDHFVQIPMYGRKNSLNVSNAFSVIAFHIHSHLAGE